MTFFDPMKRALTLAAMILVSGVAPTFAAPADIALLQSYLGEWRGRGVLIGASTETVVCRMNVTQGNANKVNYSGRCTLAGTQLSVAGTMLFNDATKRYEAAMSSNANFTGVAIGQKRAGGLVFNLRERDKDEKGKDLNITSQINLKGDAINVVFEVVYVENGDSLRAEVPFSR